MSGFKAGMLTFGGAYTVIPFLQEDAVAEGAWMTNAQFLDGLALSSLLPAPLIIFATFVGYLGGGAAGAVVLTFAIFLPAFAMTLLAHEQLERLVNRPSIREFLEGVTAGVVGLIAGTTIALHAREYREPLDRRDLRRRARRALSVEVEVRDPARRRRRGPRGLRAELRRCSAGALVRRPRLAARNRPRVLRSSAP